MQAMQSTRAIRVSAVLFFCAALCAVGALAQKTANAPIDRHALVTRHNVVVHEIDPNGAMAVGNGDFAFNFDVTGLQSFPEYYAKTMPIGILSDWGWHSFPNPDEYTLDDFPMTVIPKYGRQFIFPSASTSHPTPDAAYLRANPHRFGLARIGLEMTHPDGSPVLITDLNDITQTLDLWAGLLTSSFTVDGKPVRVTTSAHPTRDEVATHITSPLIASGRLKIRIAFPYASDSFGPDYQDWTHPERHTTILTRLSPTSADFDRTLDSTHYTTRASWSPGATLVETAPHQFLLSSNSGYIELTACFSPNKIASPADSESAGFITGAPGESSTSPATPTPAPPNSSAASSSRSTSWPSTIPARCPRRRPASVSTPGTANTTWRCTGGTPPTGRSGDTRSYSNARSTASRR
jgi:hypothetical protein